MGHNFYVHGPHELLDGNIWHFNEILEYLQLKSATQDY